MFTGLFSIKFGLTTALNAKRPVFISQMQSHLYSIHGSKVGGKKKRTVSLPVLLPHEVLHMISASPFVFDSVWLGCLDDVSRYQFWGHIKTLSPWKNHPVLQSDVDLARLIGVNIHGDGAVMKRDDECFVWSVSSCFASSGPIQDPLMMKFAVAIVHERFMLSKQAGFSSAIPDLCLHVPRVL